MYRNTFKSMWAWPGIAAAVALPVVCLAVEDKGDRSRQSRVTVGATAQSGQTTTVEGQLISLHEFMTAGTTATAQGSARANTPAPAPGSRAAVTSAASGPWALKTGTDVIILSNLDAAAGAQRLGRSDAGIPEVPEPRIGAAPDPETSSNRDLLDRDDDVAGVDRPVSKPGFSDRSDVNRPQAAAPDETEGAILGIPRAELDKAGQRIQATGTLYNRDGLKYMVVSSVKPAAGDTGATGADRSNRDRSGAPDRSGATPRDRNLNRDVNVDESGDASGEFTRPRDANGDADEDPNSDAPGEFERPRDAE